VLKFERDGEDLYPLLDEAIDRDPDGLGRRARIELNRSFGYFLDRVQRAQRRVRAVVHAPRRPARALSDPGRRVPPPVAGEPGRVRDVRRALDQGAAHPDRAPGRARYIHVTCGAFPRAGDLPLAERKVHHTPRSARAQCNEPLGCRCRCPRDSCHRARCPHAAPRKPCLTRTTWHATGADHRAPRNPGERRARREPRRLYRRKLPDPDTYRSARSVSSTPTRSRRRTVLRSRPRPAEPRATAPGRGA
jgi:hypothetical protein